MWFDLSCLCLCRWVDQLFMTGCRRSLVEEDLYANPSEADAKHLLKKFNR